LTYTCPHRRLKWAILFGFCTFFSFLYANQIYFEMLHNPRMPHSWWRIAFWQLLAWHSWGCLSPLILKLGRRFPCEGPVWLRGLPVHLSAAVMLSAFHIAVATALRMLVRPFDVWSDINPFLVHHERLRLERFHLSVGSKELSTTLAIHHSIKSLTPDINPSPRRQQQAELNGPTTLATCSLQAAKLCVKMQGVRS
jgi:hypothetical protein